MKNNSCLYAEINLDAISHNIKFLKARLSENVKFMAVVKANAYGHGDKEIAKTAEAAGADFLGVARIDEGIKLRQHGIKVPVLVFCPAVSGYVREASENMLSVTISDIDTAKRLSDEAVESHVQLNAHLKVDTGMGRLGFFPSDFDSETKFWKFDKNEISKIIQVLNLPNIKFEGIFTHFSDSDSHDKVYTLSQFNVFQKLVEKLEVLGHRFSIQHAANSAAILDLPQTHLDMVRAGISIYGLSPFEFEYSGLVPAMTLKTRIIHLKKVPGCFYISYGRTWKSDSERTIATVSAGYADGYRRIFSSKASMLVRGQRAPVVGRVCMDLAMIDVTDIPDVKTGDEVIVFGRHGNTEVSASELAAIAGTINYEIVTGITDRVKRVYR